MSASSPLRLVDDDGWQTCVPFDGELRPPFPTKLLPDAMGLMADAVAVSTQVPVDVVALGILGVASAAVAGKVLVRLRADRQEQANLWTASVLPSGERKSAAFAPVVAPLVEFEQETAAAQAVDVEQDRAQFDTLLLELGEAKKQASKGKRADRSMASQRRDDLATRKAEWVHIEPLQLVIDDSTPEAAVEVLARQGGRIALISDEAQVFFAHALGKYAKSKGVNIDSQLKAYSGSLIVVNRKNGRGQIRVPRPALTIVVTMQPRVLREAGDHPDLVERGLLPRFQFAVPKSIVGFRDPEPPLLPRDVQQSWRDVVHALCRVPERRDEQGQIVADVLDVDDEGLGLLRQFRVEVEQMLRPEGRLAHIREWGNRVEGNAARVALVLHMVDLASRARHAGLSLAPPFLPIDARWIEAAIGIAREYWIPHALAAFALMNARSVIRDAQRLRDWIVRNGKATFSQRDAHRGCQSWLGSVTDLEAPLQELEERAFVRPAARSMERRPGRPASPEWEVNPALLADTGHGEGSAR